MQDDYDHYQVYYADKLWNLLPVIYRAEDTEVSDNKGPLRELVNRIGAQAAILRRSMDRMWEDQSIETCDDWVIPYIADLLATNLVASLDARGQRLDVANTIYYRRRKGTVAILEEVAFDITGWDARVVEFFRRMGRTRHGLDPEIGSPSVTDDPKGNYTLQLAEGLVGALTGTGIGGWADLRNAYGDSKTGSAFDEFFHTADFRRGQGQVGWYNISHLGVFLWRLRSFGSDEKIDPTTPVFDRNCKQYTFDPTGREIPLFAKATHSYGDNWMSPEEWQLPTPISTALLQADLKLPSDQQHLYAAIAADGISIQLRSLGVFRKPGDFYDLVSSDQVQIFPERGRFSLATDDEVYVMYHYGFSSTIGAGPFERRILREKLAPITDPASVVSGGGNALTGPLASLAPAGTITIGDSLTYDAVSDVGSTTAGIQQVTLRAVNKSRPLIRLPGPNLTAWAFTGAEGGKLFLEGLFVSGGDIVLRGVFDSVTLTCCTLDPGTSGETASPPTVYAKSVDGRDLIPCRLWVEAQVRQLNVERCIMGPIRTRLGGEIEKLTVTDSIVQAIRTSGFGLFNLADLKDPTRLASKLRDARDPLSSFLRGRFTSATSKQLDRYSGSKQLTKALQRALVKELNALLTGPSLYDANRFKLVRLRGATLQLTMQDLKEADLIRLNRLLLEEAYPLELADSTIALSSGEVDLTRCTLLGPAYVHHLSASECILDDVVLVEDPQHACVRFSAWAAGSILPQAYESVEIVPGSPLFNTRVFGQPGYAQLLSSADTAVLSPAERATISQGAQNGSEMGAFAREKNPIKERSLRIKYEEFMPLGLTPVIIYVT
jgi:hypothetical protein